MTLGMSVNALAADTTPGRDNASSFANSGTTANSGISSFYLIKEYDSINQNTDAPHSSSPAETFTYEITPYAVWNAGSTYSGSDPTFAGEVTKITKDNMPMLTAESSISTTEGRKLTVNQAVNVGDAKYEGENNETQNTSDKKVTITLPTYDTVGDYWYKVEETFGNTTGVIYGTNSNNTIGTTVDLKELNGNYSRIYYIHVQVTENSSTVGTSELVRNVTMHKSAPNTTLTNKEYNAESNIYYVSDNKVNAIENTYYAGDLVIKKNVTGNAGDKDEYFKVTVEFSKPQGTIVNSDIPFSAVAKNGTTYTTTNFTIKGQYYNEIQNDTIIKWTGDGENDAIKTATCIFYVKDNSTVTFSNVPYGINYTIKEEKPDGDTYKHKFTFGSADGENVKFDGQNLTTDKGTDSLTDNFSDQAEGSISDKNDTVTIENNKVSTIDIGVVTTNAPYIAMLILAVAALVLFVHRRKTMIEE